ncbi:MAG: hypothetical protein JXR94_16665 [Candidatus Hydrogenedentes bacterium]|nr:hypothetical protein [Candidatus Hydrogenedentota bacterium]
MSKTLWHQKLTSFKEDEQPEAVLLVAGQAELARIAVAWTQIEIAPRRNPPKPKGRSSGAIWAWLWANTDYDRSELLARVPNATSRTDKNLDALIAARVLYPDGTLNSFVQRYLCEQVARLFAASTRRRQAAAAHTA